MFFDSFRLPIGIDLGTSNTLAIVPGRGIIFDEPTILARQRKKFGAGGKVLAFGKAAKNMLGKEPRQIEVVEPLVDGAIADFDAICVFLSYLVETLNELPSRLPRLLKPKAVIGVPSGITEVERRAVRTAALEAKIGEVFLVEEPMAMAIGIGLPVEKPSGNLLIDIGGGTAEIAVISLGGIVLNRCLRVAGKEMDETIVNFLRMKQGILIGLPTAERIKVEIGSVAPSGKSERFLMVKGRDLETGLPKTVKISEAEVREAISPIVQEIVSAVSEVLEETPPELTADLAKRGIILGGGGVLLKGMEELISQTTKMPVWTVDNPLTNVVRGCAKLTENKNLLERVMVTGGLK